MNVLKKPVFLDDTGQRIALALEAMSSGYENDAARVHSLTETQLMSDTVFEVAGYPEYVGEDDLSRYASFGIQSTGWYIFARIFAKDEVRVTSETTVEGTAGYIAVNGNGHVDVAVRFDVSAVSQVVVIDWGVYTDTYVFRATDLAIRNLDYRVTFYVYDADEFATWEFGPTGDAKYLEYVKYFNLVDGEYVLIDKSTYTYGDQIPGYYTMSYEYTLTTHAVFYEGTDYYTFDGTDYTEAEVVIGAPVPAETYYNRSSVYTQATGVFEDGVTYYVKESDYTEAEVVVGTYIPSETYYTYNPTYKVASGYFQEGVKYYLPRPVYTEAEVTVGEDIPVIYKHSNITFEGMTRNITYRFNEIIDCPTTFILPEIEDDGHGAWFEIRCRHAGSYSMTLVPPTDDIKIATEHTQSETAGMNMINLHYTNTAGSKVWRFMNTHSSYTPDAPALVSIAFRSEPVKTEYTEGETLNLEGAVIVATYEDGTSRRFTDQVTFTPAPGTVLTTEDTAVVATYTVTVDEETTEWTASVELTVTAAEGGEDDG